MGLDFTEVEDALQAWLRDSAGVTAVWAEQSAPRPDYPYATLAVTGLVPQPGTAEIRYDFDEDRDAGSEVRRQTLKDQELVLSVQFYTRDVIGPDAAFARAARARVAALEPDQVVAFFAAGLSVENVGAVQRVPTLVETRFEGRAIFEVRFWVRDGVEKFLGYIATLGALGATYE